MSTPLAADDKNILTNSSHIRGVVRVFINGNDVTQYVRDCSYSFGRDFISAESQISLLNKNNIFKDIKRGQRVAILEGLTRDDGYVELYSGFCGSVKSIEVNKSSSSNDLKLTCLDDLNFLNFTDIEYKKTADKIAVHEEELIPNYIFLYSGSAIWIGQTLIDNTQVFSGASEYNNSKSLYALIGGNIDNPIRIEEISEHEIRLSTGYSGTGDNVSYLVTEGLAQVFDSANSNWAKEPMPTIVVREKDSAIFRTQILTEWSNFQVKYSAGQVILGTPLDVLSNNLVASYEYYPSGLYVEDIIEDFLTQPDWYGRVVFSGDNLTSTLQNETRNESDKLTPNYTIETHPDRVGRLFFDVSDYADSIYVKNATDFYAPPPDDTVGYLAIDGEVISYEGTDGEGFFSGLSRGVAGTTKSSHKKGGSVYQAYLPGSVWYTSYNNIITDLSDNDFNIDSVREQNIYIWKLSTFSRNVGSFLGNHYQSQEFTPTASVPANTAVTVGCWTWKIGNPSNDLFLQIRDLEFNLLGETAIPSSEITTTEQYIAKDIILSQALTANQKYRIMFTQKTVNSTNYYKLKFANRDIYPGHKNAAYYEDFMLNASGKFDFLFTFYVPSSNEITEINKRYGFVTLKQPINLDANAVLDKNYEFKTIQATGVQINEIEITPRSFKTRLDALKFLKEQVAPNYTVRSEGDGKVWGSYLNQKIVPDYTVSLIKNINWVNDPEIYTRVKLYAENNEPTDLTAERDIEIVQSTAYKSTEEGTGIDNGFIASGGSFDDGELVGLQLMDSDDNFYVIYGNYGNNLIVSGQPASGSYQIGNFNVGEAFGYDLEYTGVDGDYYIFKAPLVDNGKIIGGNSGMLRVYVNGVRINGPSPTAVGPVPVKVITDWDQVTTTTTQGGQVVSSNTYNTNYSYMVKMPHTDIVSNIYSQSGGAINTDNDIFVYLPGIAGGGIKASIQFFKDAASSKSAERYRNSGYTEVGDLEPVVTLPIRYKEVDYEQGIWHANTLPMSKKVYRSVTRNIAPDAMEIYYLEQEFYVPIELTQYTIISAICKDTVTVEYFAVGPGLVKQTYSKLYFNSIDYSDEIRNSILLSDNKYIFYKGSTSGWPISSVPINSGGKLIVIVKGRWYQNGQNTTVYIYDRTKKYSYEAYEHEVYEDSLGSYWIDLYTALTDVDFSKRPAHIIGKIFADGAPDYLTGNPDGKGPVYPYWGGAAYNTGHRIFDILANYKYKLLLPDAVHPFPLTISGQEVFGVPTVNWREYVGESTETFSLFETFADSYKNKSFIQHGGFSGGYRVSRDSLQIKAINTTYKVNVTERNAKGTTYIASINRYFAPLDNTGAKIIQNVITYKQASTETIGNIGSAIYYVWHKDESEKTEFYYDSSDNTIKILKALFAEKDSEGGPLDKVTADFKYAQLLMPIGSPRLALDGLYTTAAQQKYALEPLPGSEVFTIDFKEVVDIDTIDVLAGYFSLQGVNTPIGQIAFTNNYSIQYSLDKINWYYPSDKAYNFSLGSGNTFTLTEDDLGELFKARYIRLVLEKAQKLDYDNGVWFVSITEFKCWQDVKLKSEASLIKRLYYSPSGTANNNIVTNNVNDLWTANEYAGKWLVDSYGQEFCIISNTTNTLTVESEGRPYSGEFWIFEDRETDVTVYDKDGLLDSVGDVLYKVTQPIEGIGTQATLNKLAKDTLREYIKNHQTATVDIVFHPAIRVGQTVKITDEYNSISRNFFVEQVSAQLPASKTLQVSYYP